VRISAAAPPASTRPRRSTKYGFKAVIAENFAEIFFGNSTTLGMPCVTAAREDIAKIAAAVEANPATEVTIDLAKLEARFAGQTVKIAQRESARDALVHGRWDAIGELLDGVPRGQRDRQEAALLGRLIGSARRDRRLARRSRQVDTGSMV